MNGRIFSHDPLSCTVFSRPAATDSPQNADWWLVRVSASGAIASYALDNRWFGGLHAVYQGPLFNLPALTITVADLPAGKYMFYFGVDTRMNGIADELLYYTALAVETQN